MWMGDLNRNVVTHCLQSEPFNFVIRQCFFTEIFTLPKGTAAVKMPKSEAAGRSDVPSVHLTRVVGARVLGLRVELSARYCGALRLYASFWLNMRLANNSAINASGPSS